MFKGVKEDMFKNSEQYNQYIKDLNNYNHEKSNHNDNYYTLHEYIGTFDEKEPIIENYEQKYMNSKPLIEVNYDDLILFMFKSTTIQT